MKNFPTLSEKNQSNLIHELTQYSLANGLIIYPPDFKEYQPNLAPVTLFPTPYPSKEFEKSILIATQFNSLYGSIVSEKKWLMEIIKDLSVFDSDFTGKLYSTHLEAEKQGIPQPVSLGLFRSDYMLDNISNEIKQVEFNTVSVSFGGLSTKVGQLHSFLNNYGLYTSSGAPYYKSDDLPVSDSANGLADGLHQAVTYYESKHTDAKTIVLFVIQPNERNAFDQRAVEYSLYQRYGIPSKRVTLPEATSKVKVDPTTKKLYFDGSEVSVVYYRSAYGPQEYDCQEAWDCRLVLETTLAIKCPSLVVQLSGAKKIQQLLTDSATVSRFSPDAANEDLLSTFVKIYPLDDSESGAYAKKLAFEQPHLFVLKPQREGGGNNVYKEDIPSFLKSIPEAEWAGFILMELINPSINKNLILRNGEIIDEGVISELGVFGTLLFNEETGEVLHNAAAGHLLRSKTASSNEGGVAAGFGCVDSLYIH